MGKNGRLLFEYPQQWRVKQYQVMSKVVITSELCCLIGFEEKQLTREEKFQKIHIERNENAH